MKVARSLTVAARVAAVVMLSGCAVIPSLIPEPASSLQTPGDPASARIPDCVPTDSEQEQAMTDTTTSSLDEAGLEQIYASCHATFDITDGQLLKADVGLGFEEYRPDIGPGQLITLRLIGSEGTLEARTDRVRFFAHDDEPNIALVTYFLTADTPEEFFKIIREGADAYGFDHASVEMNIDDMTLRPNIESKFVAGTGYDLGFEVIYEVRYKGPGHVNVIIVNVNPAASEQPE